MIVTESQMEAMAAAPAGGDCGDLALAVGRALAGTYVLKFKVRSALMSGAFSDGDDDDAAECAHRCCECSKEELAMGAQIMASLTGGVPGSLGAVVSMSCIPDAATPSNDQELIEMMSKGHDCISDAWKAAAEAAMQCGQREIAQFAAERAEKHAECADCLDDLEDDGEDEGNEVEEDAGEGEGADGVMDSAMEAAHAEGLDHDLVVEAFTREIGHVVNPHPKKTRPKRLGTGPATKPGARTAEEINASIHKMASASQHKRPANAGATGVRVGLRTSAEMHAQMAKDRVGKPLKMGADLLHKASAIGRPMPRKDRRRLRKIADLTHAELKKKIGEMQHSG